MAELRDIPDTWSTQPNMVRFMRIIVMSMIDDRDLGRRLIGDGHEIVSSVVLESDAPTTHRGPVLAGLIKLARVLPARNRPVSSLRRMFDNRAWLAEHEIPVMHVSNVNASNFVDFVRSNAVDLIVVAMLPQILRREMLSIPGLSAINYHPSPLPDYAGRQPTFWMIRNRETRAAITVHRVAEKVDSGDILARQFVESPMCASVRHQGAFSSPEKVGCDIRSRPVSATESQQFNPRSPNHSWRTMNNPG